MNATCGWFCSLPQVGAGVTTLLQMVGFPTKFPVTLASRVEAPSNLRPFGLQARIQSTEPHQPGLFPLFKREYVDFETIQSGPGWCISVD